METRIKTLALLAPGRTLLTKNLELKMLEAEWYFLKKIIVIYNRSVETLPLCLSFSYFS